MGLLRFRNGMPELLSIFIEPGSPWENGYVESFHGKFRDELLSRELFDTLREAQILIDGWRKEYNTIRPHSALGYRPPAPEAMTMVGSSLAAVAYKPHGGTPPTYIQ